MSTSTPTDRDQSFAETALRLGGKTEEEARRMGAVDKADEQVEALFEQRYQTSHSPIHQAVWDRKVPFELFAPPALPDYAPCDVAMNKAAADHEQTLGRPVMAGFHGWFSVGMVAGVGAGAAALLIGIPPLVHAAIVIVLAVGVLSTGLPAKTSSHQPATGQPQAVGWGGRRVAALAGVAFICLFLEGAMADWSGLLTVAFGAGPAAAPRSARPPPRSSTPSRPFNRGRSAAARTPPAGK